MHGGDRLPRELHGLSGRETAQRTREILVGGEREGEKELKEAAIAEIREGEMKKGKKWVSFLLFLFF